MFGGGRMSSCLLACARMPKSVYIVVGELSGDAHGAGLLRSLRRNFPDLAIRGAGGPQMKEIVDEGLRNWVEDSAVMGFWEVLKHYGWFKQQFAEMLAEAQQMQPDVLLLVDYPGFNLRFAKAVRACLPKTKIVYYISPQVWAWNRGRIPKMVKLLDEMMCLFPFEREIFASAGLRTTFVGHPLVDELEAERQKISRDAELVALLPGSREREVTRLFPTMLESAKVLHAERPNLRFEAPAASGKLAGMMRKLVADSALSHVVNVTDGGSLHLMQRAACGVIASGTATLEAAYFGLPNCLVYKVAAPTYYLAKMLIKIPYIGLVNILAGKSVVRELIQDEANPTLIVAEMKRLLFDEAYRAAMIHELKITADLLGGEGAHERAASRVAEWLGGAEA